MATNFSVYKFLLIVLDFYEMKINQNLEIVSKSLENLSNREEEINGLYLFISQNLEQFFEISERMVSEVKYIKDRYPKNWKEMVAMTMFSTP